MNEAIKQQIKYRNFLNLEEESGSLYQNTPLLDRLDLGNTVILRKKQSQQIEAIQTRTENSFVNLDESREGNCEECKDTRMPNTMEKLKIIAITQVFGLDPEFIET